MSCETIAERWIVMQQKGMTGTKTSQLDHIRGSVKIE